MPSMMSNSSAVLFGHQYVNPPRSITVSEG